MDDTDPSIDPATVPTIISVIDASNEEDLGRGKARAAHRDDEVTEELTGSEASPSEAARGDAGNGASPWGADLTGVSTGPDDRLMREDVFEEAPSHLDILPDHLEAGASDEEDEDNREITARPKQEERPITPDLLPSDDPAAAH